MIISGGVNIYPQEVEDLFSLHPPSLDIAVIGVPDDEMGERVVAYVEPVDDDGATDRGAAGLRARADRPLQGAPGIHRDRRPAAHADGQADQGRAEEALRAGRARVSDGRTGDLERSVEDGVLRVTFTRPEHFNALTGEMVVETARLLRDAVTRDDVRVVVSPAPVPPSLRAPTSRGRRPGPLRRTRCRRGQPERSARSSGVTSRSSAGQRGGRRCRDVDRALRRPRGRQGVGGAHAGLHADRPDARRRSQLHRRSRDRPGRGRCGWRCLRPAQRPEAYAAGLVTHVFPDEEYAEGLARIVRRLAVGPPLSFAATKRAVNAATLAGLEDAFARERAGQSVLLRTEDVAEGMRAFGEKRRPNFTAADRPADREVRRANRQV